MTGPRPDAMLSAALSLAARGWHVFPCVPGGKRPALRSGWEQRATTDPARIARCWGHAAYNIGIACGPSGLVAIDLDTPKPGTTPPPDLLEQPGIRDGADTLAALCEAHRQPFPSGTCTVRTGRGGLHLYFTAPPGPALRNTAGRLGWLIDTRAAGGYVIAAGSTVDGNPYSLVNDTPPEPLPAWLAALLTGPGPPPSAPAAAAAGQRGAGYAAAALRGEVQRVLDAAEGTRNHALNHAAFALGQLTAAGAVPVPLAYDALLAAARQAGLTAREADATIRSGLTSGARQPRGTAA
jgi:hypothetical protein